VCVNANGHPGECDAQPYVYPPQCLPSVHGGTTEAECTAINKLWQTKFNFCCPWFFNYGGDIPQIDITSDYAPSSPYYLPFVADVRLVLFGKSLAP
jgi:hypothetical protein